MLVKRETKRETESMAPRMKRRQKRDHSHHARQQRQNGEHDHYGRRHPDLLQGLGQRTARYLQPWLAPKRRRLGGSDGLPGAERLPHDRRGHGRSSQPSGGNDMDTYADDLAALFEELDLRDAILVGHSTGGGEVTRYIGRHGTARVAKVVLVSAIPPLMLKTEANPEGLLIV